MIAWRQRAWVAVFCLLVVQPAAARYDVVISGGVVFDGSGAAPRVADVAVTGDRIAAIGQLADAVAAQRIDATGLAIAPGFINVLSWADEALIADGRSQGNIRQGVTLEVFGEGRSRGPLNDAMRAEALTKQDYGAYPIAWTSLDEFLRWLVDRGVSANVASFVGATTVRVHALGYADRAPDATELARMQALVRQAMEDGALGVGSSLIYAPGAYAATDELVALARAAAAYGGTYSTHLRSEAGGVLDAVDEFLHIVRSTGINGHVHHLKVAGREHWQLLPAVLARLETARDAGLPVTANMYTYTAGATGFDAAMPPWVQAGGDAAWFERLTNPEVRARVLAEMRAAPDGWDNLLRAAGAEGTLLTGFRNEALRPLIGQSLAAVARARGVSPEEAVLDLVVEDRSEVDVVYFFMDEANVARKLRVPWITFGSDARSMTAGGVFLSHSTHPRAYGNFARLLGRYVRDEGLLTLQEAVRRLTSLPAEILGIQGRGALRPGYHADIAVFDPELIQDQATYADPHRYAIGMRHVLVNGTPVLLDGTHTGALPGRVVRGPGWRGRRR